jgi:enoyl-CoA hydratase/carnithine racemase
MEPLLIEDKHAAGGAVRVLTMNRPDKLNALNHALSQALYDALWAADSDDAVAAIVLTGAGRAFCAGQDLAQATRGSTGITTSASVSTTLDLKFTPPTVLFNMDTPVICALNGSAAGYGMDTALGCDMRLMAKGAKMAAAFTKRGILPESGGTWFLPRMLGWAKAAELIFTGRTLTADQCLEMGLVSEVVADDQLQARAREVAVEIAANAPLAVQASKRLMRMGLNETFNDHVHHVFLQLLPLLRTEDAGEGMRAFMEKRPADFKGR